MNGKRGGSRARTEEEFLRDLAERRPDVEYLSGYVNYSTKALFRCKECGHEWWSAPSSICLGHGCPQCVRRQRSHDLAFSEDEFKERLAEVLPGYELVGPFKGLNSKATVRCPEGHERTLRAATFIKRPDVGRCPQCNPKQHPEDIDEATLRREYLDEGLSLIEISQRHHRSFDFIKHRMRQYGIALRPRSASHDITKEVLEDLYMRQGLPVGAIVQELGCSTSCLYRHLAKYGFPKRHKGYDNAAK